MLKSLGIPSNTVVTLGRVSQEEVAGLLKQPGEKHFFFDGGANLVVDETGRVLTAKAGERHDVDWRSIRWKPGDEALGVLGLPKHVEIHLDPCVVADEVLEAWLAKPLKKRLCYVDVQIDIDLAGIVISVGPSSPSSPLWRGYEEWDRRHQ